MHHGNYPQRLLKDRDIEALDGRNRAGKKPKVSLKFILEKKGGRSYAIATRETIEAGPPPSSLHPAKVFVVDLLSYSI